MHTATIHPLARTLRAGTPVLGRQPFNRHSPRERGEVIAHSDKLPSFYWVRIDGREYLRQAAELEVAQ